MDRNELLKWVKEDLIFKRLKLADMGIALEEIGDETLLFDDEGLALDSIDGLEFAVGIEQKFGIKIGKLTEEVARKKFANAAAICDYILDLQNKDKS